MVVAGEIAVSLSPEMERALRAAVESGEYASPSAALDDALRLWLLRHEVDDATTCLKARIGQSLDDPRGDIGSAELDARLEEMFASKRKASASA